MRLKCIENQNSILNSKTIKEFYGGKVEHLPLIIGKDYLVVAITFIEEEPWIYVNNENFNPPRYCYPIWYNFRFFEPLDGIEISDLRISMYDKGSVSCWFSEPRFGNFATFYENLVNGDKASQELYLEILKEIDV